MGKSWRAISSRRKKKERASSNVSCKRNCNCIQTRAPASLSSDSSSRLNANNWNLMKPQLRRWCLPFISHFVLAHGTKHKLMNFKFMSNDDARWNEMKTWACSGELSRCTPASLARSILQFVTLAPSMLLRFGAVPSTNWNFSFR